MHWADNMATNDMSSIPSPPKPENQPADRFPDQQFLSAMNMLLQSARIHRDNNRVLISSVRQFISIIRHFLEEEDEVTLLTYAGRFYLQQEKIVYRSNISGIAKSLLEFFEQRKLNGFRFLPAVAEASAADIASFARLLISAEKQDDPPAWLEEELARRDMSWVEYVPASEATLLEVIAPETDADAAELPDGDTGESDVHPGTPAPSARELTTRQKAVLTYGYAVQSLQEIARKVSSNQTTGIKKALRMVHKLIDMVTEDRDVLFGLSTIRHYDDYTFTHSINVAILSMCLGHRIGLSKKSLEILTLSAVFHDLGKIDVPKSILNKPGKLTDQEFKEMKNHSLYSVRQILMLKTTQQKKAEMLLAPFEHHLKYDLSGYPQTPRSKPLSLFGRIIAIADVFDALTASRVYRPYAIIPDQALSIMQEGSGKDFDPLLLKVFINMIGVYPIGTLLKLDNGEIGLVAKYTGERGEKQNLWVQLLEPTQQGRFVKGELLDLGSFDPGLKQYRIPITETLHPAAYNIQPADFLL
jgi:HD-GYP domain-containing protein (c-di-GMP phosphodiesterase class II)